MIQTNTYYVRPMVACLRVILRSVDKLDFVNSVDRESGHMPESPLYPSEGAPRTNNHTGLIYLRLV